MTHIPIDMDEVPTHRTPLDTSVTYRGIVRSADAVAKPDKNGDTYAKVTIEVISPDEFKGRTVPDNYLRFPVGPAELEKRLQRRPTEHETRDGREKGVRFARFIRCFRVPYTPKGVSIGDAIGREGSFTVNNEEYPAGSGDLISKVQDYLEPAS